MQIKKTNKKEELTNGFTENENKEKGKKKKLKKSNKKHTETHPLKIVHAWPCQRKSYTDWAVLESSTD